MIVPFEALKQLPPDTLNNLIREYLLTQVEDGSFDGLESSGMEQAIAQCRALLKRGELVVEYSEDNDSIGIRHKSQLAQHQGAEYD
ncbi:YheU family protein [Shewanella sp. JM162201]|uniref:YheU family protein n=1 Tax=Shewanella jiangmenensis TaxID=2837387 RepID=A0ABS5V061_9GAMM|nr:YheU family protein [Shewanella jiangmenensis]MBT1443820.1 YheU family protein [Shewanella jiangmenensis]